MPTHLVFRDDAYRVETPATVTAITERGAIILDRTVFYANGGGQPGDSGVLIRADGTSVPIQTAVWNDAAKTEIAHVL
ncbi:MAG: alanine--tRNA ligase-related protein, partial [Hyphomicrobiales bacterium]